MLGRRNAALAAIGIAAVLVASYCLLFPRFPSDRTPAGAYLRIAKAVNIGRAQDFFAYLETPAQHAAFTIRDYRKKARDQVLAHFPEPERTRLAREHEAEATAPDGPDVFAFFAEQRGWISLLRRDLSGVAKVEIQGERASIETVRGTRYPFRRRDNGIWGITLFTAALSAEAEKAARDGSVIDKAASDYEKARGAR